MIFGYWWILWLPGVWVIFVFVIVYFSYCRCWLSLLWWFGVVVVCCTGTVGCLWLWI